MSDIHETVRGGPKVVLFADYQIARVRRQQASALACLDEHIAVFGDRTANELSIRGETQGVPVPLFDCLQPHSKLTILADAMTLVLSRHAVNTDCLGGNTELKETVSSDKSFLETTLHGNSVFEALGAAYVILSRSQHLPEDQRKARLIKALGMDEDSPQTFLTIGAPQGAYMDQPTELLMRSVLSGGFLNLAEYLAMHDEECAPETVFVMQGKDLGKGIFFGPNVLNGRVLENCLGLITPALSAITADDLELIENALLMIRSNFKPILNQAAD